MRLMQGALGASLRYGLGAILPDLWHWRRGGVFAVGGAKKQKSAGAIGVFTVSGAAVEYFGSLFQELCFGSVSWDYSDHMLNLGGRVSLKMAFMWGGAGYCVYAVCLPLDQPPVGKDEGNGLADCLCGNDGLYGREPAGHFRRDYPVENTGGRRACQQSCCPMAGRYLRRPDHGPPVSQYAVHRIIPGQTNAGLTGVSPA